MRLLPITVKAQGANANITSVNSAGYGASVNNASYVTIEGFRMANLPDLGRAPPAPLELRQLEYCGSPDRRKGPKVPLPGTS